MIKTHVINKQNPQMREKVCEFFFHLCGDAVISEKIALLAKFSYVENEKCILSAGERTDDICLIVSGAVRGYYIDENGNDITKCFSMEGEWCCTYSYLSKGPSPFYIEAIEDTILAEFDIKEMEQLVDQNPDFRKSVERLLGANFMKSEERLLSFTAMEAKDRYQMLVNERPDLIARVKQEYIASYIGVTPSSLSRLKKKL